ncbi:sulfotransferase [Paracoccus sp. SCSIO 75233]|uniref:sulfotransferase family protein n=1 Tax=Paracoccus sp. SCSIO 75233 TaxID=3017782 RepID=UPI0022F11DB3|nr:sulfotransferase [Paracoccus sp. SCSIO 75233]WBU52759.1 sulfotransferase [Paracoccus sp. SCSIO 75233]
MTGWVTDGKPRKPRVVCIGAQKAGTTWLHTQLSAHPKIWAAPVKELHYFDGRHVPENMKWLPWHFKRSIQGIERRATAKGEPIPQDMRRYLDEMTSEQMFTPGWYRRIFSPAPPGTLPLDSTPEYSTLPEKAVDEVATFLPNAKFIYLIRDPVDRAISQLRMNLSRHKTLPKTPEGYLAHLDDPVLDNHGDYATYIPRWQARFGPDRLLILPYGRIASDPAGLMREVEAFLGIAEYDYPTLTAHVFKGSAAPEFPEEGRRMLRARFAAQYDFLRAHFDEAFNAALGAAEASAPTSPSVPHIVRLNEQPPLWLDPPQPRLPSVIGIGAQKAGTSWLHRALAQHPGIWAPPMKEAHYFDHLFCPGHRKWTPQHVAGFIRSVRSRFRRKNRPIPSQLAAWLDALAGEPFTDDWYRGIFAPASANTRPLDITPAYSCLPDDGVDHIASYLPDAQFIYLIRDPVDRAMSQLRMNMHRRGQKPETDDEWFEAAENEQVLADRGDYAAYLPRWQARLGADRLLVLPYGHIASMPASLMRRIERFLDLPPHDYTDLDRRVFSLPEPDNMPDAGIREILSRRFSAQYDFLRSHFDRDFNAALR